MKPFSTAWLAVLAISSTAAAGSPAGPGSGSDPTREQWIATVSQELEGTLRYPVVFRDPTPSGAVSVTFNCSDTGRPSGVKILRRSGDPRIDRAAMSAIQRIKTLHPLPAGIGVGQVFQANIVFAYDERDFTRRSAIFRTASTRSAPALASNDAAPLVIGARALRQGG